MDEEAIDRDVAEMLAAAQALGLELDGVLAREKAVYLHAQAEEHGVAVEDVERRNLLRALFGGGARP